jgi:hypothetical protein
VLAGFAFFFGGRAIAEFTTTKRLLAEVEGMGLAVLLGIIGFVVKRAADNLSDDKNASG